MAGDPVPECDRYYDEALSIPLYYGLSDVEQSSVVGALRELVG